MSNRPVTYDTLTALFAAHHVGSLPIRPNTVARVMPGGLSFTVRYYDTDIAVVYSDGRVKLDRHGKASVSTRNRMNDVLLPLGWRINIKDGDWWLTTTTTPKRSMRFVDGMILTKFNYIDNSVNDQRK